MLAVLDTVGLRKKRGPKSTPSNLYRDFKQMSMFQKQQA